MHEHWKTIFGHFPTGKILKEVSTMNQEVHIEAYDAAWAHQYAAEAMNICSALGNAELLLEHIGSTAVPGLSAKPVVDMMLGVEKLCHIDEWKGQLEAIGYEEVHHPDMPERRFFRKGPRGAGTHHLHIYVYQSEAWNNQWLFREELRRSLAKRKDYERLKQTLARLYPHDRKRYTAAKAPFIQRTIKQAQRCRLP